MTIRSGSGFDSSRRRVRNRVTTSCNRGEVILLCHSLDLELPVFALLGAAGLEPDQGADGVSCPDWSICRCRSCFGVQSPDPDPDQARRPDPRRVLRFRTIRSAGFPSGAGVLFGEIQPDAGPCLAEAAASRSRAAAPSGCPRPQERTGAAASAAACRQRNVHPHQEYAQDRIVRLLFDILQEGVLPTHDPPLPHPQNDTPTASSPSRA